jgi:hypothetical protein
MRTLLVLAFLAAVPTVFGQSRTVDNFTLDKFKQQRLAAEKDLRENYAKLGFPSPEELERQRQKDDDEKAELLDKIREERLERERIELERQRIAVEAARSYSNQPIVVEGGGGDYGYGYDGLIYSNPRGRRGHRYRGVRRGDYPAYRVTPVGVFPADGPPRSTPVIRRGRLIPRR